MKIRRANATDFNAVNLLLDQLMSASAERQPSMWSKLLDTEGYIAWVAEADARIVGFLDLFLLPDMAHGSRMGLINNLVVDGSVRGKGLGEGLLREAIKHSRRQGVVELHIWTEFENELAIGLYKKLGFAERALVMELEIGE